MEGDGLPWGWRDEKVTLPSSRHPRPNSRDCTALIPRQAPVMARTLTRPAPWAGGNHVTLSSHALVAERSSATEIIPNILCLLVHPLRPLHLPLVPVALAPVVPAEVAHPQAPTPSRPRASKQRQTVSSTCPQAPSSKFSPVTTGARGLECSLLSYNSMRSCGQITCGGEELRKSERIKVRVSCMDAPCTMSGYGIHAYPGKQC